MKYYDISLTITSDMVTWPSDPGVILERVKKIEEGAHSNVSKIDMGVHTGTHMDAPIHFVPGATSIERLPLDVLIGEAQVIQLNDSVDIIDADIIQKAGMIEGMERVLFKTRNSGYWARDEKIFYEDFVAISEDGAQYLVDQKVKLVGVDYLSVGPYKNTGPTHVILLKAGIIAVEGLNLHEIDAGLYTLYCLPIKLGGSDGAPVRAILAKD
jgi:arylformamidase